MSRVPARPAPSRRRSPLPAARALAGLGACCAFALAAAPSAVAETPVASPFNGRDAIPAAHKQQILDSIWAAPTATNAGMGVFAARAANLPGIRGEAVQVVKTGDGTLSDRDHVEIAPMGSRFVEEAGSPNDSDHSLSTGSVAVGQTVGVAPNVQKFINIPGQITKRWDNYNRAVAATRPGDVILLEAAWYAPHNGKTMPVEYELPHPDGERIFDYIRAATDLGRNFIEPAANDEEDLDSANYLGYAEKNADGTAADSGAIIVGWGQAPVTGLDGWCRGENLARVRQGGTFGSRVDVQGPGCSPGAIRGTPASVHNAYYQLSGTSGASAVVAGVVAALSSTYEASTAQIATPDAIRNALKRTGSAQRGVNATTQKIGPLPNLTAARTFLLEAPDTSVPTGPATSTNGLPTFGFTSPSSGVTYECRVVPDPLPTFEALVQKRLDDWKACGTSFTPATALGSGDYRVQVRAVKPVTGGRTFDPTPSSKRFSVVRSGSAVSRSGGTINVSGSSAARTLAVATVGADDKFTDTAGIAAGTGCTQVDWKTVTCAASGVTLLTAYGSAAADSITVAASVAATANVYAQAGDDNVRVLGPGDDLLVGGDGEDTLAGGGAGDDEFTGGAGQDSYAPEGSGDDVVYESSASTEDDAVIFTGYGTGLAVGTSGVVAPSTMRASTTGMTLQMAGIDTLYGTSQADSITTDNSGVAVNGGGGNDVLTGGTGPDVFDGGPGLDTFSGKAGNDRFAAKDGVVGENIRCDAGTDSVVMDLNDVLADATGCESVSR